jgi:sugar/nucleoside kinase (ribokinase family)
VPENFLAVFGHTVMDHIMRLPKLPTVNRTVQVEHRETHYGGTGANMARIAARLGVKVSLASFVGEDFPQDYRRALEADGVDIEDLVEVPGSHTPVAWIFTDPKGDQVTVIDQGAMKTADQFDVPLHSLDSADLVHIATGRPEFYARVMEAAKERNREVAFDPSQEIHYVYTPESFSRLLEGSRYFFGNECECERAVEYVGGKSVDDLLEYVEVVVVTRGAEGSAIHGAEGSYDIPAMEPAETVDVTGAGDAYRAGFYAALSRELDLESCGYMAASAASYAVEGEGPQGRIPTWDEVRARAEKYR